MVPYPLKNNSIPNSIRRVVVGRGRYYECQNSINPSSKSAQRPRSLVQYIIRKRSKDFNVQWDVSREVELAPDAEKFPWC
jgi:hypothetical protein